MLLCSWQHSHHCGDYNLQDRNACSTSDISQNNHCIIYPHIQ